MKTWIKLLLLSMMLVLAMMACACVAVIPPDDDDPDTHRVMLTVSEGITVTSENPVQVKTGEDATFTVAFENGYVFESITGGTFDTQSNTVTVKAVTGKTSVNLVAKNVGYDTSVFYRFYCYFASVEWDKANPPHDSRVNPGMSITVTAGDTQRVFVGWSFKGHGIDLVSTDREFTFTVTPELADSRGVIVIYSCYSDANVLYYDANGGEINTETNNYKGNANSTVADEGNGKLKVTLSKELIEYQTTAIAFYNDGTFHRDGYVLKEYNTKPDGTGTSYAPGDKVNHIAATGEDFTLYCIWEEASADDLWNFSEYTYPEGTAYLDKHGFLSSGIIINSYTGAEQTVVVPEEIDGKAVIGIDAGAFDGITRMKELILPRTIQFIRDGAFVGCTALSKVVYPTGIVEASDAIMDAETKSTLKTLFTYHNLPPVYAKDEPGGFSVKLSRLMTTMTQNRLIILGGSSVYQGVSSRFLERLFGYKYCIINFGTTRTTHGALYLEAIAPYLHEGDIVVYAPENSIYMLGDNHLYWKTIRDMEMMGNLFKNVDISKYENVFSAFSSYARDYIYNRTAQAYEDIVEQADKTSKYGDESKYNKSSYVNWRRYKAAYAITFNELTKSIVEFGGDKWDGANVDYEAENDYKNPENTAWVDFTKEEYTTVMNSAIDKVKAKGATATFGFCPVDEDAIVADARNNYTPASYQGLISRSYHFDALIGQPTKYVYAHEYFYDCAFHLNDYGRALHTYQIYLDLCAFLGMRGAEVTNYDVFNVNMPGCIFETTISVGYTHEFRKYPTKLYK